AASPNGWGARERGPVPIAPWHRRPAAPPPNARMGRTRRARAGRARARSTAVSRNGCRRSRTSSAGETLMTSFYGGAVQASKSVLIVEHDDTTRATLATAFEDAGYVATLAQDGKEGLETLARTRHLPCLIVLADATPAMNGAEFIKLLNADTRLSAVPVALMSERTSSWFGGAARVFKKPVD